MTIIPASPRILERTVLFAGGKMGGRARFGDAGIEVENDFRRTRLDVFEPPESSFAFGRASRSGSTSLDSRDRLVGRSFDFPGREKAEDEALRPCQ